MLRFIGVTNAAVWLGAAVFLTFGAAPAFFSPQVKELFRESSQFWPGLMAQMVLERYFYLQYVCGAVALVHQLAEWVYLGRALERLTIGLLIGLIGAGFLGGLWLQPKLRKLHQETYGVAQFQGNYRAVAIPEAQRQRAKKSFGAWHGVSQVVNLAALLCLLVYFWKLTHPSDTPRFVSATKFRS